MKPSLGGSKYFMNIHDQFSRFNKLYLLKSKDEAPEKIIEYLSWFKTQTGEQVKALMCDGGREFINNKVKTALKKQGTELYVSNPGTAQQNGLAERNNQTITQLARTMLLAANLKHTLWAEACLCASFLVNITNICKSTDKSAFETIYKIPPNLSNLRPFGSRCYYYNQQLNRTKWTPRGIPGIMVGYTERVDGYRVWQPGSQKVILTKDVRFIDPPSFLTKPSGVENSDFIETPSATPLNSAAEHSDSEEERPPEVQNQSMSLRKRQDLKPPKKYETQLNESSYMEPNTYNEAMRSVFANQWRDAMQDEMNSMKQHKVWSLVDLPTQKRPISCRWVFKIKTDLNGEIDKFRARLVVRGNFQKYPTEFTDLFAPVARFDTVRFLLALCAARKLFSRQFDVKTAFLYGDLKEEIYMTQPPGFADGSNRVCRLHKSLYGLRQAPRSFNTKLTQVLKSFKLLQSQADPCLYYRHERNDILILAVYVDDAMLFSSNQEQLDRLLEQIGNAFEITSSALDTFLGIQISIDKNHNTSLNQKKYIRSILNRFQMQNCKELSTPSDNSIYYIEIEEEKRKTVRPYRELIGSLMYLAICTRPDIAFSVSFLSRFLDNYTEEHWNAALKILRYLQGSQDLSIVYVGGTFPFTPNSLEIYTDADYAASKDTRKSVSGSVTKFNGGPILWSSKQQKSISISTTESEFISATEGAKDALWLNSLFKELKIDLKPRLLIDNQSALKLIQNPQFHMRTKHIDVRYKFIRETYQLKQINFEYISTDKQLADLLTKPLPRPVFQKLLSLLGLQHKYASA